MGIRPPQKLREERGGWIEIRNRWKGKEPKIRRKWEILTFLILALELVNKVVDKTVVEVLATQVGVAGGGLDLEDALLDGQKRHIEGTTTQVEDEDVALALDLLVETVSDSGSGRFVDDTQNVEARNKTSILGSLALRVVEVGRYGNDSIAHSATEVGLSGLAHLGEDH